MLSRLGSLTTLAVIADCTRNDHSPNFRKYFAYFGFCDFFLSRKWQPAYGLSNASFPQIRGFIPSPSRLSESGLGKIPTDKEAQQDHALKGSTHKGFPDGLAEAPLF